MFSFATAFLVRVYCRSPMSDTASFLFFREPRAQYFLRRLKTNQWKGPGPCSGRTISMRFRRKVSPAIGSGTRASFGRLRKLHSSVKTMACSRLTMGRMTRHSIAEHKRILLVGVGAIGGLYAAYLAKVSDVAVLDTNRTHVEAI